MTLGVRFYVTVNLGVIITKTGALPLNAVSYHTQNSSFCGGSYLSARIAISIISAMPRGKNQE